MTTIPTAAELDLADQHALAYDPDPQTGLDTTALTRPPEQLRHPLDTDIDELPDRIDQAWITPHPDDDYHCLAY